MTKWSEHIIKYISTLTEFPALPPGISALEPFDHGNIQLAKAFYKRFYADTNHRVFLIGINPGRFGAGTTGVPFTDPIRLAEVCHIQNNLDKKAELSSKFVYDVVASFGGPTEFFGQAYITSTCPIGFIRNGKNFNYYDHRILLRSWEDFMINALRIQLGFGPHSPTALSLGQGKNYTVLQQLNEKYHLFRTIKALPHPRWVMQYRLKKKAEYLDQYILEIKKALAE